MGISKHGSLSLSKVGVNTNSLMAAALLSALLLVGSLLTVFNASASTITGMTVVSGPSTGGTITQFEGVVTESTVDLSFIKLANGDYHSLGLTADGRVYAWGENYYGQVGNGTMDNVSTPTPVGTTGDMAGKTIVDIAAGGSSSYAIDEDGSVYSWGNNESGQLGLGEQIWDERHVPTAIDMSGALNGKSVTQIAAGLLHAIALTSDGQIYAWGEGSYGQLGKGPNFADSATPTPVDMTGTLNGKTTTAVGSGKEHSFAITDDGQLYAWGYNGNGQLGDGTKVNKESPVPVSNTGVLANKEIAEVWGGEFHSVARTSDGQLYSWGSGDNGELGLGALTESIVPAAIDMNGPLNGKKATSLTAGNYHTVMLTDDNQLYAWGRNGSGELGNGTYDNATAPTPIDQSGILSGKSILQVSAGERFALVLDSDGYIYGWGQNFAGQLGTADTADSNVPTPAAKVTETAYKTPTVTFGSMPALNVELVDNGSGGRVLQAIAPAHTPGAVDVIIAFEGQPPITLAQAFTYLGSGTPEDVETPPVDSGSPSTPDLPNSPETSNGSDPTVAGLADTGVSVPIIASIAAVMILSGSAAALMLSRRRSHQ